MVISLSTFKGNEIVIAFAVISRILPGLAFANSFANSFSFATLMIVCS